MLDSLKSSLFPRLNQNLLKQSLIALGRLILDGAIWLLALTPMGHPLLWMVVNLNLLTSGSTKKRRDCNQSKIDKRLSGSRSRQARLLVNRNNQVRDYLNQTARLIIDHCIAQKIERVIVGFNLGQKQEINIGSRNNQNFVQIPFHTFRGKLSSLCERYGLLYLEQEESYTSLGSALDGDDLPVYNAGKPATYQFSGKRVKRGLYQTWEGLLINADCNGAANIGRKSKQNGFTGLSRGCADTATTNLAPRLIAVLKNPLAFRQGSVKTT